MINLSLKLFPRREIDTGIRVSDRERKKEGWREEEMV